jgi:hypothetical protein
MGLKQPYPTVNKLILALNRSLRPTVPQCVVAFFSNSPAAGSAPGTQCAQNQSQHTARLSRFLLAPFPVFSAAPSGAAAEPIGV